MELLDGDKLKNIRVRSGLEEKEILRRSGLKDFSSLLELENNSKDATFKTLLMLSRTFEKSLKDFMPEATVNVIYSQSEGKLQKIKKKHHQRFAEYPLVGSMGEVAIEVIIDINKGEYDYPPELSRVKYASYVDPQVYCLAVEPESAAPEFLLNSNILVSPGTKVKDGDYCIVYDLTSGNRFIRSVLKKQGYYILQPDDNSGSLILSDSQLIIHKIIGSVGAQK